MICLSDLGVERWTESAADEEHSGLVVLAVAESTGKVVGVLDNPVMALAQLKRLGFAAASMRVEGRVAGLLVFHRSHHSSAGVQAAVVVSVRPARGGDSTSGRTLRDRRGRRWGGFTRVSRGGLHVGLWLWCLGHGRWNGLRLPKMR